MPTATATRGGGLVSALMPGGVATWHPGSWRAAGATRLALQPLLQPLPPCRGLNIAHAISLLPTLLQGTLASAYPTW